MGRGFTWFLFLLFGVLLVLTWGYASLARLVPLVILVPAFLLTAAWLWRDYRGGGSAAGREGGVEQFGQEMRVLGWFVLLVGIIWLLGFLVAIPAFLVVYLRRWAGEGWPLSLGLAGIFTGAVYLAFEVGFHMILYRGWLFSVF